MVDLPLSSLNVGTFKLKMCRILKCTYKIDLGRNIISIKIITYKDKFVKFWYLCIFIIVVIGDSRINAE